MGRQKSTKAEKEVLPVAYHHGDLREALIQAGIEILEERGMAALTLRETARRAGVSHAAPYHHFTDKEALLAAVAARGYQMQRREMSNAAAKLARKNDELQAYGLTYTAFAQAHPSLFRLMYTLGKSKIPPSDELNQAAASVYDGILDGIREKTGCDREQARSIALLLWSSVHGITMLWLDGQFDGPDAPPLEALAFQVTEALAPVLTRQDPSPSRGTTKGAAPRSSSSGRTKGARRR